MLSRRAIEIFLGFDWVHATPSWSQASQKIDRMSAEAFVNMYRRYRRPIDLLITRQPSE